MQHLRKQISVNASNLSNNRECNRQKNTVLRRTKYICMRNSKHILCMCRKSCASYCCSYISGAIYILISQLFSCAIAFFIIIISFLFFQTVRSTLIAKITRTRKYIFMILKVYWEIIYTFDISLLLCCNGPWPHSPTLVPGSCSHWIIWSCRPCASGWNCSHRSTACSSLLQYRLQLDVKQACSFRLSCSRAILIIVIVLFSIDLLLDRAVIRSRALTSPASFNSLRVCVFLFFAAQGHCTKPTHDQLMMDLVNDG